jgi:predicted enzyme related to lactoylglutathione lyase
MASPTGLELGELSYLYIGVDDVERSVAFYESALGAVMVWRFRRFGTEVAGMRVSETGPLVLLAEHRPVPSCLPIWTVPHLEAAVARLTASGFATSGETAGTPDGPVHVFQDSEGNQLALLQADRPHALDAAYADPDNDNAVR